MLYLRGEKANDNMLEYDNTCDNGNDNGNGLFQKLKQLIDNNSSTPVDLYWGLQRCTCDSNPAH